LESFYFNKKQRRIVKQTHKRKNIDVDSKVVITIETMVWDDTRKDPLATALAMNDFVEANTTHVKIWLRS
jgi:hypothetical protein